MKHFPNLVAALFAFMRKSLGLVIQAVRSVLVLIGILTSFFVSSQGLASAWLPLKTQAAIISYQKSESHTFFNSLGNKVSQSDSRENWGGEYGYKWSDAQAFGFFFNTAAVTASVPRLGVFGQQQLYTGSSSVFSLRLNLGQESGDGFFWPQVQWGLSGSFSPDVGWFVDLRPGYWVWMNSRAPSFLSEGGAGLKLFERHLLALYYLWQKYDRPLTANDYQREYVDVNYFYQVHTTLRLGLGYHQFLSGINHPAYSGWQIVSLWDWGE